jgi:hypothetical protein
MARRGFSVNQFSKELDTLDDMGERVVKHIKENDLDIYLMGHLYPEEFEKLISEATNGAKLEYAHGDLMRSMQNYDNIKYRIRKLAKELNEAADLIDARDTFVYIDLDRLRDRALQLPSHMPVSDHASLEDHVNRLFLKRKKN